MEVGPGTGLATVELLGAGAVVTAVELSDALADRLEERFAGRSLTVVRAAFEEADLPTASFDLAAAATAFHWVVSTEASLVRCADLLRPDGWLARWWNAYGDPARADPCAEALDALLHRIEPALADRAEAGTSSTSVLLYALDADARIAEIDATGRFRPVQYERIEWIGHRSAARTTTRQRPSTRSPLVTVSEGCELGVRTGRCTHRLWPVEGRAGRHPVPVRRDVRCAAQPERTP